MRDPVRRDRARAVFTRLRDQREDLLAHMKTLGAELDQAMSNRGTSRLILQAIVDEIDVRRTAAWRQQLDERFRLRGALTAEEWKRIFPVLPGPMP